MYVVQTYKTLCASTRHVHACIGKKTVFTSYTLMIGIALEVTPYCINALACMHGCIYACIRVCMCGMHACMGACIYVYMHAV